MPVRSSGVEPTSLAVDSVSSRRITVSGAALDRTRETFVLVDAAVSCASGAPVGTAVGEPSHSRRHMLNVADSPSINAVPFLCSSRMTDALVDPVGPTDTSLILVVSVPSAAVAVTASLRLCIKLGPSASSYRPFSGGAAVSVLSVGASVEPTHDCVRCRVLSACSRAAVHVGRVQ